MDTESNANFDQMLNPNNIANTIRMLITMGSVEIIQQFSGQADMYKDGPEFLAVSCQSDFDNQILVRNQTWPRKNCRLLPQVRSEE